MEARISMITLGVSDLEKSISFYRDGLGFPMIESPPSTAFFNLNGTWLGLYPRDLLAEDANIPSEGQGFSGITLAHNVESETDVDQLMSEAIAAGAELVKQPQRASWGGYSGYFRDGDGYLWELAHNPHFWIGPTPD